MPRPHISFAHLNRHALEHVRPSCGGTGGRSRSAATAARAAAATAAAAPRAGVTAGGAVGRRPRVLLPHAAAAAALLHVHLCDDALQAPCEGFFCPNEVCTRVLRAPCGRWSSASGYGD